MFARFVSMGVKSGNLAEFNRILEKEVIPLLQRQKGFREEIVLTNPSGAEAVGISIWEQKENAESYNREKFPEVQQLLTKVLDGTARVKTRRSRDGVTTTTFSIPFGRRSFKGLARPQRLPTARADRC